jgi:hypothetical protein
MTARRLVHMKSPGRSPQGWLGLMISIESAGNVTRKNTAGRLSAAFLLVARLDDACLVAELGEVLAIAAHVPIAMAS